MINDIVVKVVSLTAQQLESCESPDRYWVMRRIASGAIYAAAATVLTAFGSTYHLYHAFSTLVLPLSSRTTFKECLAICNRHLSAAYSIALAGCTIPYVSVQEGSKEAAFRNIVADTLSSMGLGRQYRPLKITTVTPMKSTLWNRQYSLLAGMALLLASGWYAYLTTSNNKSYISGAIAATGCAFTLPFLSGWFMRHAVLKEQFSVMEWLLRLGIDIDGLDFFDFSPVQLACVTNRANALDWLLQRGANGYLRAANGALSPFYLAAMMDHVEPMKVLLRHGFDIDSGDKQGCTDLWRAVQLNERRVMELLIANGANPNVQSPDGATPLESALILNRIEALKCLLQHGADPNVRDRAGYSLLIKATLLNRRDMTKKLLHYGAARLGKN